MGYEEEHYSSEDEEDVEDSSPAQRRGWGGAGGGLRVSAGAVWHDPYAEADNPKRFPRMSTKAPDPLEWQKKQEV
jgi:hypothetical protein